VSDLPGGPRDDPPSDRQEGSGLRLTILLVLAAAAVYLLGYLLWPFFPALMTSAVMAALVYPAYRPFESWVGQKDVAALATTIVVFFLVLVPMVGLSLILADQVGTGIDWLRREAAGMLAPEGALNAWLETAAGYLGVDGTGLPETVTAQMQDLVRLLAGRTLNFLSGLGGWLLQAGAAVFAFFYLIRDADGIMRSLTWLVPLEKQETEGLVRRTRDVIYATVYGNVVVAIVQGALGGLAFWVLGLPASALWGTVMVLLSLLPIVGAPFVWAPAGVILVVTGEVGRGIALLIVGALLISTIDNYLRAVLVSDRTQLHPLVVFFSVLGGLFAFGAVGLFVGPVLFAVGLTILEMARLAMEPGADVLPADDGGLLTRPPEDAPQSPA
jgi:predicted PurR-regulated permease PerM